jgi:uncharacterized protein YndB with AHSA1/START domain
MENSIIVQKKINASVERVWQALTDKKELPLWYFDIADFKAEVGKVYEFYEPGEEKKYLHQIEILEVIQNQKLKHTWTYPTFSEEKTFVNWELKSDDSGTLITLTHEGTEKLKDLGEGFSRESFTQGWNSIIGQSLNLYLQT